MTNKQVPLQQQDNPESDRILGLIPLYTLEEGRMNSVAFEHSITDDVAISEVAQEKLLEIVNSETEIDGIRVFVSGGGCSGMTYGMTLVESPTEFDCSWERNGLKLFVDAVALNFLRGLEIDYEKQGLNSSFVFKNVFSETGGSGTCGSCGAAGGGCA